MRPRRQRGPLRPGTSSLRGTNVDDRINGGVETIADSVIRGNDVLRFDDSLVSADLARTRHDTDRLPIMRGARRASATPEV